MATVLFDHSKLKGKCREKGETLESLARKTGLSARTLSKKWNGKSSFTDVEIYMLKALLDLENVEAYFFAPKV